MTNRRAAEKNIRDLEAVFTAAYRANGNQYGAATDASQTALNQARADYTAKYAGDTYVNGTFSPGNTRAAAERKIGELEAVFTAAYRANGNQYGAATDASQTALNQARADYTAAFEGDTYVNGVRKNNAGETF